MGTMAVKSFHLLVTGLLLNVFLIHSGFQIVTVVLADGTTSELECEENEAACADGSRCYSLTDQCDKIPDCSDGSDESDCDLKCPAGDISCKADSLCLPSFYRCDGTSDCSDNSDEQDCDSSEFKCMFESEFKCETERRCIVELHKCDGIDHCLDGSDEKNCHDSSLGEGEHSGPAGGAGGSGVCDIDYEFDCKGDGTECIKIEYSCDEHVDCSGGQDENSTTCSEYKHSEARPGSATPAKNLSVCDDGNPCAHFCDPAGDQYICSCKEGYHLAPDKLSCFAEGAEPELIFGNSSQLISYGLRSQNKTVTNVNTVVQGLAYDHKAGKIFYIDHLKKSINWISKDEGSTPTTLVDKYIHEPVSIAYDWIHGNLYWADVSPHAGAAYSRIEAVSVNNMVRTTVLSAPAVKDPRQLTVDPRQGKGYLYWAQIGTSPSICRAGLDGSEPDCFVTTDIQQPSGLTIDYVTNTLYWVDKHLGQIIGYDLVRLQRHTVTDVIEYPRHPTSLDIFEDMLYWADDVKKAIYRWNVLSTAAVPKIVFENLDSTKDVVVYHPMRFPEGENYCGSNNGGCSHICLPSPHFKPFTCACPNVEKAKNGTVTYVLDGAGKQCLEKKVVVPTSEATTAAAAAKPGGGSTAEDGKGGLGETSGTGDKKEHDKEEEGGGGSLYIIVGAVIGVIVVLVIVAIVVWRVLAARRANQMQFSNPSFETKPLNKPVTNGHGVQSSAA